MLLADFPLIWANKREVILVKETPELVNFVDFIKTLIALTEDKEERWNYIKDT